VGVDEEQQPEGEVGDQPLGEAGSATGVFQAEAQRTKPFDPTSDNTSYVCQQIKNHDLGFFFTETFPELPNEHVCKCLEIIWEVVHSIRDDEAQHLQLPTGALDHPKYGVNSHQPGVMMDWEEEANSSPEKLDHTFAGCENRGMPIVVDNEGVPVTDKDAEEQPTITQDVDQTVPGVLWTPVGPS
jgi:hypothetical protein